MNKKFGIMAWVIYVLVINVLMFLLASYYTATFWMNFIFVTVALVTVFVFQLLVWRDEKAETFLKISPVMVSYIYLVAQLPLGILFSWGEIVIPFKVVLIVHLIVMAIAWMLIIGGYVGNEHIDKVNSRQKTITKNCRSEEMDTKELMTKAMLTTEALPEETIFVVKELFLGTTWNNLMKGDKLSFGRAYKNAVKRNEIPNVVYIGKADNNSAQYQKRGAKADETINM